MAYGIDLTAMSTGNVPDWRNRVSDNVGSCQALLSALLHALKEERRFALLDGVAFSNRRLARNRFQVRTQSDPCISSVATAIMITTSNSSVKRSRTPNQFLGVLLHTIAISGLSRVRTELDPLRVIPFLTPHPIQPNRQLAGHRNLGGFPPSPHHQVEILAAPLGHTAHRHLRRFHQQKAHHRTPLLGDMPQSSPVPTGIFQRHQSQIARHLLATLK